MVSTTAIRKQLSRNDTGETGSHMAGILIPKRTKALRIFHLMENFSFSPAQEKCTNPIRKLPLSIIKL